MRAADSVNVVIKDASTDAPFFAKVRSSSKSPKRLSTSDIVSGTTCSEFFNSELGQAWQGSRHKRLTTLPQELSRIVQSSKIQQYQGRCRWRAFGLLRPIGAPVAQLDRALPSEAGKDY